ncbi:Protein transport protein Sec24-like At3g07100 [Durusdinium trenchii]
MGMGAPPMGPPMSSPPMGGPPLGGPPMGGMGGPPMGGPPMGMGAAPMGPPMSSPPMGGPPLGGPPMGGMGGPPMGGPPMGAGGTAPPPMKSAAPAFPGTGMASSEPPAAFAAAGAQARALGGYPMDSGMPGAAMPGQQQQSSGQDAYSAQFLKDVETFNSPTHFVRCSVSRLPNSLSAKQRLNIPLGVILQPLAPVPPDIEPVPSVNFGVVGTIVRCKQCRTYVNPFVQWEANGRRWNCNLCGFSQLTPDPYYASLDESGKRMDRFQRAELHKGAVEYIAPGEYMVRPPQPPVFMFVIDVSYTSVVTGLLQTVVTSIKEAIESGKIPGGQRIQVGIITFDTSLHFYNLNSNLSQPQMLVVSDLDDLFLPLPDDILVPLAESETAVLNLLDSLPSIFGETKVNESCLGSAVRGAFMAMKHIGGKLLVFGACIPSVGELALKSTRDNPRLLGTDREVELLRPAGNDGYKELGKELTPAQISVELFLAPQAYMDLASICPLAKYTGGDVHYYPQFNINTCFEKFKAELVHVLTRYMGWEAVMRVRVSRGWKITKFDGHLFIRGQDLLVVPNCHSDQTFAIQIDMEENVTPDPVLYVQSALLYTNSEGERRIRVHTWAAMTTPNFNDIIGSIDVQASAVMMSHQALEQSLKSNQTDGRNKLSSFCQQVVQAGNMSPQSDALQFLPLYIMGMLKSAAFRATNDISADLRTYIWMRLETLSVSQSAAFFNPRLMALHNAPDSCRVPNEHGQIELPEMLNLTSESMTQDGVYLLEDGESMYMWIGRAVDTSFLQAVFGTGSFEQMDVLAAESMAGTRGDPLSEKIANILRQVRAERPTPFLQLQILRQGDPKEAKFFAALIEDRTVGMQSTYTEFLQRMGYRSPQQQAPPQSGMPAGGMMAPPRAY